MLQVLLGGYSWRFWSCWHSVNDADIGGGAMAWGNQYRMLAAGEIIMEGDEVDACRDGWRDEPKWQLAKECIGQPAPDPVYPSHRVYRRKLAHTDHCLKRQLYGDGECECQPRMK